jgi:hypothetical protein
LDAASVVQGVQRYVAAVKDWYGPSAGHTL